MSDPAAGWWLASDGKWYPPQGDAPPPPAQASGNQPFIGPTAVQPPGWVPSEALPQATRPRRKKRLVLALVSVVVIIVVLAAIGASTSGGGGSSAASNTSAVCADLNSLYFNGGPTITYLENVAGGSNTTVATVEASLSDVQAADTTAGTPFFHAPDLKVAAANAATLAAEIPSGIQVDSIEGGPDDLHTNLVNIAKTLNNAASGDNTYVGTGNESDNVEQWSTENCAGGGNTGTTGAGTTF